MRCAHAEQGLSLMNVTLSSRTHSRWNVFLHLNTYRPHRDARKIVVGDLTHDGVAETVVVHTIESQGGSNNYTQYLAVFARHGGKLSVVTHAEVGGKSVRSVELASIEDDAIRLDTLGYAEGRVVLSEYKGHDALCPRGPGAARTEAWWLARAA